MNRSIPDPGDDAGQFAEVPPVEMGLVSLEIPKGRVCVVVPLESVQLADQLLLVIVVNDEVLRQLAAVPSLRCFKEVGVTPVGIGRQNHTTTGLDFTDWQSE